MLLTFIFSSKSAINTISINIGSRILIFVQCVSTIKEYKFFYKSNIDVYGKL